MRFHCYQNTTLGSSYHNYHEQQRSNILLNIYQIHMRFMLVAKLDGYQTKFGLISMLIQI